MRYKKLTTVILSLSLAFSLSACVMSKQKTKEAKNNQEYTNIQDSLVAKYNKKITTILCKILRIKILKR